MEMFFALLILVPTAAVLILGVVMILAELVIGLVAGVDGIVVGLRHRLHGRARAVPTHYNTPALHH